MEQVGAIEALATTRVAGSALDAPDPRVDRLAGGVGRLEGDYIEYAAEVLLHAARDLLDGAERGAQRLADPSEQMARGAPCCTKRPRHIAVSLSAHALLVVTLIWCIALSAPAPAAARLSELVSHRWRQRCSRLSLPGQSFWYSGHSSDARTFAAMATRTLQPDADSEDSKRRRQPGTQKLRGAAPSLVGRAEHRIRPQGFAQTPTQFGRLVKLCGRPPDRGAAIQRRLSPARRRRRGGTPRIAPAPPGTAQRSSHDLLARPSSARMDGGQLATRATDRRWQTR